MRPFKSKVNQSVLISASLDPKPTGSLREGLTRRPAAYSGLDKLGLMMLIILGGTMIHLKSAGDLPLILSSLSSVLIVQMAIACLYFARQPILACLSQVSVRHSQEPKHHAK